MNIIVGERLNATRKTVRKAIESRDQAFVAREAELQTQAGATHLDANAGTGSGHEVDDMEWLVTAIQKGTDLPLCLDSPDPSVLEAGYDAVQRPPIVNSISLEKKRLGPMLDFLRGKECQVVALCMNDEGLPKTAEQIVHRAVRIVGLLEEIGIPADRILIDPLIQPIATSTKSCLMVLEGVRAIRKEVPGVHFICGLSNVSFGMPARKTINRSLLPMLMAAGMDGFICDPLDRDTMSVMAASRMLLDHDPYCMGFIQASQKEALL